MYKRQIIYFGSKDSEIAQMVDEEGVGQSVASYAELAEVISNYVNDSERRSNEGAQARVISEGKYSRANAMRLYAEVVANDGQVDQR